MNCLRVNFLCPSIRICLTFKRCFRTIFIICKQRWKAHEGLIFYLLELFECFMFECFYVAVNKGIWYYCLLLQEFICAVICCNLVFRLVNTNTKEFLIVQRYRCGMNWRFLQIGFFLKTNTERTVFLTESFSLRNSLSGLTAYFFCLSVFYSFGSYRITQRIFYLNKERPLLEKLVEVQVIMTLNLVNNFNAVN